jgi:hypothetical protein
VGPGITLASVLRGHDRASLRAAWWAARSVVSVRRQLARQVSHPVPPAVPPVPPTALRGVSAVLRRSRTSCLVRATVRQAWHAAHGTPIELVIGVTAPAAGFRAHAWLEGDPESTSDAYTELLRRPAPVGAARVSGAPPVG